MNATTNDPGPAGYLLAWAVSVALTALAIGGVCLFTGENTLVEVLGIVYLYGYFAAIGSVPFASVGILAVHLACRRVRAQWVHVVAAGLVGLLPLLVFWLPDGEWLGFADGLALVPVATAIGRWSVVPLVRRRREAFSRGALAAN